jgi:tripartite-type tricarboxylate transporter receptor subunit TctC
MKTIGVLATLYLASSLALAQSAWPTKPVTIVVPFAPGGGTDTGARLVAEQLTRRWGQPVVVENRSGAAGQISADFVAKSKPDGHTLLMGNIGTQAINPALYVKMPYDPDKAFSPVAMVAELPLAMMVNASFPVKNVKEFIALAKSQPGEVSYSSSGAGGVRTWRQRCSKTRRTPSFFMCPIAAADPPLPICWQGMCSCLS